MEFRARKKRIILQPLGGREASFLWEKKAQAKEAKDLFPSKRISPLLQSREERSSLAGGEKWRFEMGRFDSPALRKTQF